MKHKKSAPENPERMLAFRLEQVQNKGQNQECRADPLGCAGKLRVERLGLVLPMKLLSLPAMAEDRPALLPDWSVTIATSATARIT